ncbi:MAG: hypothetical protein JRG97_06385 [Deltaproteobacteria bacterium]|nr:hypothetical protein [Deltaproteobacteria bacterium]MBW2051456.1 hypothetical protein [Deltaproteobacteria bacterium]MBW2140684.1 hypothetical protein [Deltaproteobacteria bacterium]
MEQKSPRDKELQDQGWTRKFAAAEPRLSEAREGYEELGFEVLFEPLDLCPEDPACTACLAEHPDLIKVIYTRPKDNIS